LLHALGRTAVARIVHEDVELAERLDPRRDHRLHVRFGRRVAGHRQRPPAVALDQSYRFLDQVAAAGGADHRGPFPGEQAAHHASDALAGAGDERHLSLELSHGSPSSRRAVILTSAGVYLFPRGWERPTCVRPNCQYLRATAWRGALARGLPARPAGGEP